MKEYQKLTDVPYKWVDHIVSLTSCSVTVANASVLTENKVVIIKKLYHRTTFVSRYDMH